MQRLLEVGGMACLGLAALWFLVAAAQGGFLTSALFGLFGDKYDRRRSNHQLFGNHWDDVKGPFWLMVFGVGLLLISAQQPGR